MGRKIVTVQRGRNTLVLTDRKTGDHVASIEIAQSAHGTRADLCVEADDSVDISVNANDNSARKGRSCPRCRRIQAVHGAAAPSVNDDGS